MNPKRKDPGFDYGQTNAFHLRNIYHTYPGGGGIAIDELTLPAGCTVAVIGENGSGKTTFLNLLGALIPPKKARDAKFNLFVDGKRHNMLNERNARAIAALNFSYIFQQPHLLRSASAVTNMMLPLVNCPDPPSYCEILNRITSLNLPQRKLEERVRYLSGGEEQKIAVGRAIIHTSNVIFADEPTSNLDVYQQQHVLKLLKTWRDESRKRTLIWVTHDFDQAAKFADQIVILESRDHIVPGQTVGRIKVGPILAPRDPERIRELVDSDLSSYNKAELNRSLNVQHAKLNKDYSGQKERPERTDYTFPAIWEPTLWEGAFGKAEDQRETAESHSSRVAREDEITGQHPSQIGSEQGRLQSRIVSSKRLHPSLILSQVAFAELFSSSLQHRFPLPRSLAPLVGQSPISESANRIVPPRHWAGRMILLLLSALLLGATRMPPSWPIYLHVNISDTKTLLMISLSLCTIIVFRRALSQFAFGVMWCVVAFGKWKQVLLLLSIFLLWLALQVGRNVKEERFVASISDNLETNPIVLTTRRVPIDDDKLTEYECKLRSRLALLKAQNRWPIQHVLPLQDGTPRWSRSLPLGTRGPSASQTGDLDIENCRKTLSVLKEEPGANSSAMGEDLSVFGRWSLRSVEVTRPDGNTCPLALEPNHAERKKYSGRLAYADVLAVSSAIPEPAIQQMRYADFDGKTLSELEFGSMQSDEIKLQPVFNDPGVIVSRNVLEQLGYKPYEVIDTKLCINLFEWKIANILGIAERLPPEERTSYGLLVPHDLYKEQKSASLPAGTRAPRLIPLSQAPLGRHHIWYADLAYPSLATAWSGIAKMGWQEPERVSGMPLHIDQPGTTG